MKHLALAATAALALGSAPAIAATPGTPGETAEPMAAAPMAAGADIVTAARADTQFSTFARAVEAAGLAETLASGGPYTVFAPTDAAFAQLPAGTLDTLLQPENREQLRSLLLGHVVEGQANAEFLTGQHGQLSSLAGTPVALDGRDGVRVGNVSVVQADIAASNGVIHAIDGVILPQQQAAAPVEPEQDEGSAPNGPQD